jgi:putative transposase
LAIRREGGGFPGDLTDAEWLILGPLIPEAKAGCRPRKTDMRSAMNAILYLLRTRRPWRYLPRDGFPPRSTVPQVSGGRYMERHLGIAQCHVARTRRPEGQSFGRRHRQSNAEVGGKRGCEAQKSTADAPDAAGYDAGKKIKGGKIHALADTLGLPIRVVVHSVALQDRDGAAKLFDRIRRRFPGLECVFADNGYNARQTHEAANHPLRLEIVQRNPRAEGFEVIKRRWVVERTFSWFGRNRRLAKDFENLADTLLAFVTLAAIQFDVRRIAR